MFRPLVAALAVAALFPPAHADTPADPVAVIDAFEANFGVRAGERRNHSKGSCATGEFVGDAAARATTRSALFSGQPVPVVARFSLAGGNPAAPDHARSPRGLALQFRLPDASVQQMAMLSTPMFGVATPAAFLADLQAKRPDPATGKPDPAKLAAFHAAHPQSRAQADYLARHNPPAGWNEAAFHGIHVFRFIAADGTATPVKWRFVPRDGERALSDDELKTAPRDFLDARLAERLKRGPVQWDMLLTLGEAGDAQTDATQIWPAGRREFRVGTLTLNSAAPGAACESVNYDPLILADGIEPGDDPVLHFRSPAYAASFARRWAERAAQ